MAQCVKCQHKAPAQTAQEQDHVRLTYAQPAMQRHVHQIPPPREMPLPPSPGAQNELLRVLERQNGLLTELLGAVNGLSALLCAQKRP